MTEDELKVALVNAEGEAKHWRNKCVAFEAHVERLEQGSAAIRAAVERFVILLQAVKTQGIERKASQSE